MSTAAYREKMLSEMTRAEKAELLRWIVRDLGDDFPGIESKPDVMGGVPCITRTRIPVWLLEQARRLGTPFLTSFVVLRDGRLTAYASGPHLWVLNHAVAETEEDMQSLLLGAGNLSPISFLLPTRQTSLFRWSLKQGMRVIKPMTLMAMGEYHEPRGCYLPSVGY